MPTVTDVELHRVDTHRAPWVFLRLHTDAGVTGVAEAPISPRGGNNEAQMVHVCESLVGHSIFDTEALLADRGFNAPGPNNIVRATIVGAFETACWDAKGRHLGVPLYDLLGGAVNGTRLPTYANGWYTDLGRVTPDYVVSERDPAEFATLATDVVDRGYDALKFNPFGGDASRFDRAELNYGLKIVGAVREAVGSDVDIYIEGHRNFDVPKAIEIASRLESYEPGFFEEPTEPDARALDRVARKSTIPIATGEQLATPHGFTDVLDTAVSVVQPDSVRAGGVTALRKVATMADAQQVAFAPHNAAGPLATAVAAHVSATVPNFSVLECFDDFVHPDWTDDLLDTRIEVDDGTVVLPDRPGLGVTFDEDVLASRGRRLDG